MKYSRATVGDMGLDDYVRVVPQIDDASAVGVTDEDDRTADAAAVRLC